MGRKSLRRRCLGQRRGTQMVGCQALCQVLEGYLGTEGPFGPPRSLSSMSPPSPQACLNEWVTHHQRVAPHSTQTSSLNLDACPALACFLLPRGATLQGLKGFLCAGNAGIAHPTSSLSESLSSPRMVSRPESRQC